MKPFLTSCVSLVCLTAAAALWAEEPVYSELIFEDDFSGEGFGERWGHYVSTSVVQDGVLIGKTKNADVHPGVDNVRFEGARDLEVSLKFKFAGPEANKFNVWFDDKEFKGAHAGHICSIFIAPDGGSISDAKTGHMANAIYDVKKATGKLDEATQELLRTKRVSFDLDLARGEWHDLMIRSMGDKVVVWVNGEEVGSLVSEGLAHETKSLVSLTTNLNDVHYDDFVLRKAPVK